MANFIPPLPSSALPRWSIVIEFCDRCRWLHRAVWVQTELFLTFGPKSPSSMIPSTSTTVTQQGVYSITLLPMTHDETAGRFRVWIYGGNTEEGESAARCIWDRKTQGGFPELKQLIVRDVISPGQSLGHSDKGAAPSTHPSCSDITRRDSNADTTERKHNPGCSTCTKNDNV